MNAAEAKELVSQFGMSDEDATEFLGLIGPQDRALLKEISEEFKTLSPVHKAKFVRRLVRLAVESREKKGDLQ